jgi:hypothetical protein
LLSEITQSKKNNWRQIQKGKGKFTVTLTLSKNRFLQTVRKRIRLTVILFYAFCAGCFFVKAGCLMQLIVLDMTLPSSITSTVSMPSLTVLKYQRKSIFMIKKETVYSIACMHVCLQCCTALHCTLGTDIFLLSINLYQYCNFNELRLTQNLCPTESSDKNGAYFLVTTFFPSTNRLLVEVLTTEAALPGTPLLVKLVVVKRPLQKLFLD